MVFPTWYISYNRRFTNYMKAIFTCRIQIWLTQNLNWSKAAKIRFSESLNIVICSFRNVFGEKLHFIQVKRILLRLRLSNLEITGNRTSYYPTALPAALLSCQEFIFNFIQRSCCANGFYFCALQ